MFLKNFEAFWRILGINEGCRQNVDKATEILNSSTCIYKISGSRYFTCSWTPVWVRINFSWSQYFTCVAYIALYLYCVPNLKTFINNILVFLYGCYILYIKYPINLSLLPIYCYYFLTVCAVITYLTLYPVTIYRTFTVITHIITWCNIYIYRQIGR